MAREQVGIAYEGNVFLRRWENGVLNPKMIGPIEATKLTLKAESEIIPRYTKRRGVHGKKVGGRTKSKPSLFSLAFNALNLELMAMIFLGLLEDLTGSNGTITAEPVTLFHDTWVKVSQRNLSAVAITGSGLDTDFKVDPRVGALMALSSGNLIDAAAVTFNASYAEITGSRIKGGTQSTIEVEVIMDGVLLEDETDAFIRVPKIALTPESDTDFLPDENITLEFKGEIERLDAESADFYVDDSIKYT